MSQGEIIKTFRQDRGLTQVDLALLVGCSSQRISNFERDATALPADMAAKMAKALGVSVDELTSGSIPDVVRLSADERQILGLYRSLDQRGRQLLIRLMEVLKEGGYVG